MKIANITVKKAEITTEDLKAFLRMTENMFEWAGMGDHGAIFEPMSLGTYYKNLLATPDNIIFLAKHNDKYVGLVCAGIYPAMFNLKQKMVVEFGWWIEPEYRCGSTMRQMVNALKLWSKNKDAIWYHLHLDPKREIFRLKKVVGG